MWLIKTELASKLNRVADYLLNSIEQKNETNGPESEHDKKMFELEQREKVANNNFIKDVVDLEVDFSKKLRALVEKRDAENKAFLAERMTSIKEELMTEITKRLSMATVKK